MGKAKKKQSIANDGGADDDDDLPKSASVRNKSSVVQVISPEEQAKEQAKKLAAENKAWGLKQYGALLDSVHRVRCPLLTAVVKNFDIVASPELLAAPTYAGFVKTPVDRAVSPTASMQQQQQRHGGRVSSFLNVSPDAGRRKSRLSSFVAQSPTSHHDDDGNASCLSFNGAPAEAVPLPAYASVMCLFAATKRKPPKPRKKSVVELEPDHYEPEPWRPRMTVEEAEKSIEEYKKVVVELRKTEADKTKKRQDRETQRAEKRAAELRLAEEEARIQRDEKLRRNLEHLRQKREARELEHEISEQRVKKILSAQSVNDSILAKEMQLMKEEEERRQEVLAAKRSKMDHVVTDLTKVRELLKQNEERQRLRALEIREHILETERQRPVFYQGTTYEKALEDYVKCRHGTEDDKHQRLYKATKMQEYGKLVSQLSKVSVDGTEGTGNGEQKKAHAGRHHHPHHADPPHVPSATILNPLSVGDRQKIGNNYLKEGFVDKSPLPPGLKLQPLLKPEAEEMKEDNQKNKARREAGLNFLREARRIGQQYATSPQRREQKLVHLGELMKEVKEIRQRTNLVERRIVYGSEMESAQRSQSAMESATPEQPFAEGGRSGGKVRILPPKRGGAATPTPGGLSPRIGGEDPSYVEVINAKIAMLQKLESLRRKSLGPSHLVKW